MRWRRASPLGLNYGFGLSPRRPHRKLIRLLRSVGYEREESPHFCLWLQAADWRIVNYVGYGISFGHRRQPHAPPCYRRARQSGATEGGWMKVSADNPGRA